MEPEHLELRQYIDTLNARINAAAAAQKHAGRQQQLAQQLMGEGKMSSLPLEGLIRDPAYPRRGRASPGAKVAAHKKVRCGGISRADQQDVLPGAAAAMSSVSICISASAFVTHVPLVGKPAYIRDVVLWHVLVVGEARIWGCCCCLGPQVYAQELRAQMKEGEQLRAAARAHEEELERKVCALFLMCTCFVH